MLSLQCGHCFSTTGYPGRLHQHGYGGAGGEQRDVAMRRDRHPEAEGHVASRSCRHPGKLARRYVVLDLEFYWSPFLVNFYAFSYALLLRCWYDIDFCGPQVWNMRIFHSWFLIKFQLPGYFFCQEKEIIKMECAYEKGDAYSYVMVKFDIYRRWKCSILHFWLYFFARSYSFFHCIAISNPSFCVVATILSKF